MCAGQAKERMNLAVNVFPVVSFFVIYLGYQNSQKRTLLFALASIAISLGFLTKSLIAILFPCATFLIFLALNKKLSIFKLRHIVLGLTIFTAIVLPWHIMVYAKVARRAELEARSKAHELMLGSSLYEKGLNIKDPATA